MLRLVANIKQTSWSVSKILSLRLERGVCKLDFEKSEEIRSFF